MLDIQQQNKLLASEVEALHEKLKTYKAEVSLVIEAMENSFIKAKQDVMAYVQELVNNHNTEVALYKFGLERFSSNDNDIKFYTGFPTYKHLVLFFEFVQPSAENMTYCYASGLLESRPACRSLPIIDELFLFLVRLRVGALEQHLAHLFNLHVSTISRKIVTWANYLYFFLGVQPIWPSKEKIFQSMPNIYKEIYPNVRVILDCTEIQVETPDPHSYCNLSSILVTNHIQH